MKNNRLFKNSSRILAMILAASMVVSLGTDVTSAMNVYAAQNTTSTESSYNSEASDDQNGAEDTEDENSVDDEIRGTTWTESTDEDGNDSEDASASDAETTYTCGKEEHTHTADCYETKTTKTLTCKEEETTEDAEEASSSDDSAASTEGHTHTDSCYTTEKTLTCGKEETEAAEGHTHGDDCYDADGNLTCTLEETEATEGHQHDDSCYTEEKTLKCDKEETTGDTTESASTADTTKGHTHTDDCYETKTEKVLTCTKDEHTHTDACKTEQKTSLVKKAFSKIKMLTASNSGINLAAETNDATNSADGLDMTHYINTNTGGVVFKKLSNDGFFWEESDTFTTADQVQGTINFASIPKADIVAAGNKLYIDLPSGIDCSKFTGTYNTYDGNTQSGTYTFEKQDDGSYRIVLNLLDNYVSGAGDTIGGNLKFQFTFDKSIIPDEGKTPVRIGDWSGEFNITEKDSGKKEDTSAKYSVAKSAGSLSVDDNGIATIDYTVTVTVKEGGITSPITMKDWLYDDGKNLFGFVDGSFKLTSGDGVNASIEAMEDAEKGGNADGKVIKLTATSGDTIAAGTYTMTYSVKSSQSVLNSATQVSDTVKNTIQDKDNSNIKDETSTTTTTGKINKSGELVSGTDGKYINYTVTLNRGTIIKDLTTAANFSDTLPDTVTLVAGDGNSGVKVEKYDHTGVLVGTTYATVNGQNITYTTDTGRYYYIITYTVKVNDSDNIPIGGLTIENKGKSTGGVVGEDKSTITVPNHVLTKSFNSQDLAKGKDGKWYNTMKWTSKIDVKGSLEGYVYEDWASVKQYNYDPDNSSLFYHVPAHEMSDNQRAAIVVKDADGNVVDSSNYTVTTTTHLVDNTHGKDTTDEVDTGLFKITFTAAVTGPVTIEYETTADMSYWNVMDQAEFTNYASLTKDGHTDYADATSKRFQYLHSNVNVIHKYGSDNTDKTGKEDYTLNPGQTTLPWFIEVNSGRTNIGDVTITDTIADGMTFVKDSLKIVLNGWNDITNNSAKATWSYDETTGTITVNIPGSTFKDDSQNVYYPIVISYNTELPESFFKGTETEKAFHNTAKIEGTTDESTYEYDVTRQVVGKNGSYDKSTHTLTYEVVINQDGSTLNGGNSLTVEDVLKPKNSNDIGEAIVEALMNGLELQSLELFTAAKSTDSSGKSMVHAGTYVQDLTLVNSEADVKSDFDYYYEKYYNSKGKLESLNFYTQVPDGKAYVIVAKYYVDLDSLAKDVTMENKATLKGERDWKGSDSSATVNAITEGETWTGHKLTIIKHDKSAYNTLLEGAMFNLEKYSGGSWTTVTTLTTGADGTVEAKNTAGQEDVIVQKTLYRVTETSAPDGYTVDSTPSYFMVLGKSDDVPVTSLPTNVNQNDIKLYRVAAGSYASIEIDRYDEKDKTKVEPGELAVNKVWVDANGNTITDTTQLATMKEITVTLTQHSLPKVTINFSGTAGTYGAPSTTVVPGTSFYSNWDGTFELAKADAEYAKYVTFSTDKKTVTISKDATGSINLVYSGYANDGLVGSLVPDTTNATTEKVDTVIGTATLNSANGWYYKWSNLDRSDGVTYTLTENAVDGYSATYTINGADLDPNNPWTPTTTGDKITITNTNNKTKLVVKKNWEKTSSHPDSVTFKLKRCYYSEEPFSTDASKYMGSTSLSGRTTFTDGSAPWTFGPITDYPAGLTYTFYAKYNTNQTADGVTPPTLRHNGTEITPTKGKSDDGYTTWYYTFVLVPGANVLTGAADVGGTTWSMGATGNAEEIKKAKAMLGTEDSTFPSSDLGQKTYTLGEDNNWSITIDNLPASGTKDGKKVYYRYEVEEINSNGALDDYLITYDYSNYSKGEITIINTNNKQYELPKTGGTGTLPWTLGGSAMVLAAMAVEWKRRRRYML